MASDILLTLAKDVLSDVDLWERRGKVWRGSNAFRCGANARRDVRSERLARCIAYVALHSRAIPPPRHFAGGVPFLQHVTEKLHPLLLHNNTLLLPPCLPYNNFFSLYLPHNNNLLLCHMYLPDNNFW